MEKSLALDRFLQQHKIHVAVIWIKRLQGRKRQLRRDMQVLQLPLLSALANVPGVDVRVEARCAIADVKRCMSKHHILVP